MTKRKTITLQVYSLCQGDLQSAPIQCKFITNISVDTKYITVSHTQASLYQSLAISQHNIQHSTFSHISLSIQSLRSVCNLSISVFSSKYTAKITALSSIHYSSTKNSTEVRLQTSTQPHQCCLQRVHTEISFP